MKKISKKDYLFLLIIVATIFLYVLLYTNFFKYSFGSMVDWDVQHWTIPDYLRKLFYNNKTLFNNLGINLGAGQNIFYYSYYGYLSPLIFVSFLLPFIPMHIYIQGISIISLLISAILLYRFILNKSNSTIALLSTLLLFSMTPLLFHAHRHIMFVIYYPFLIMGLYGVDNYISNKKSSLLILSIFLLIMTNYFFSVPSLICLYIYGMCQIINTKQNHNYMIIKQLAKFTIPFFVGVLLSSIIILPTFYTLIFGRSSTNINIDYLSLLLPDISLSNSLYSSYSIGLNFTLLFPMIYFIIYKKEKDVLSISLIVITLLLFPIFSYVINATMYADYKVFIPFCPLVIFVFSRYCIHIKNKKISIKHFIYSYIIVIVIALLNFNKGKTIATITILELLMIPIQLIMTKTKIQKNKIIYVPITIILIVIICISSNYKDKKFNIEKIYEVEKENKYIFDKTISHDNESLYRVAFLDSQLMNANYIYDTRMYKVSEYSSVSNNFYKDFYYNYSGNEINQRSKGKIVDSANPFFNTFMGIKYIYSPKNNILGYTKIEENIYKNENALPILFSSKQLMSEEEFEKLEYPYNMEAYLKYIIVDDIENKNVFKTNIEDYKPTFVENGIKIENDDHLKFEVEKKEEHELLIDNWKNKEDYLIISFDLSPNNCPRDIGITINGTLNILSCKQWKYYNGNNKFKYIVHPEDGKITIELLKGKYEIKNIQYYKLNTNILLNNIIKRPSKITYGKETLEAEIEVEEDNSYILLTIPFDNGFEIIMDNKPVKYELANKSFIGVKANKGYHTLTIKYKSPLLREGLLLSSITLSLLIVAKVKNIKKKK